MKQLSTLVLLAASVFFGYGCAFDEPTASTIRFRFEERRAEFEELRAMFDRDAAAEDLRQVDSDSGRTVCGDRRPAVECLSSARWTEYARRMRRLGVLWVERDADPERTYFVLYHRAFLMDARLRGIVHVTSRRAAAEGLTRHQEWSSLGDGWYSYLMIDS